MLTKLADSDMQLQSDLRSDSKLVHDFLSPDPQVLGICDELGYQFRDRIYNQMITAMAPYQGKQTGETSLLRTLLDSILPGRILLADRYYASFWLLAMSDLRNIDLVARDHHLRKVDFRRGLKQGDLDQIVAYRRPERPSWMGEGEYSKFPKFVLVRHLRYQVAQKGFRTREVTLATTLMDAEVNNADELNSSYGRRWSVERHIRSLKTQMQMEHLRCQSPQMVRKEIHCHMMATTWSAPPCGFRR